MRKFFYKYFFLSLIAVSLIDSCNFLEVEKIGKSDIETYFSEVTALEPAIYGVYNSAFSFYDRFFILYSESASDEIDIVNTASEWMNFHNFTSTSNDESTAVGYLWKYGYSIINNCSQIIEHCPQLLKKFPENEKLIKNVLGQAYFMRALLHFDLCRVYGHNYTYTTDASHLGIAVLQHIPGLTEAIMRSTVKQTYQAVLDDLERAKKSFIDQKKNRYLASADACDALLARLYLYMGEYEKAIDCVDQIIDKYPLTPAEDYVQMFTKADSNSTEVIFSLNGLEQSTSLYKFFFYESPQARPSDNVTGLFKDNADIRKTLFTYNLNGKSYVNICMKYTCTDEVTDEIYRYYNPILFRSSELYLIRAEANNHLDHSKLAKDDIKALEARACGKLASDIILGEDIDAEIENERVKELCFEGHRFFDLTRNHKDIIRSKRTTSSVRTLDYPDYRMILQIPYVELDANSVMQNNPTSNE